MNPDETKMKSNKVDQMRKMVYDVRKNDMYNHMANLYAISLGYPIQYDIVDPILKFSDMSKKTKNDEKSS
jgi:hypothetical protein